MRKNVDVLLYTFAKELGYNGKNIGIIVCCVSIFNLFSILFGLIALMRYRFKEQQDLAKNNLNKGIPGVNNRPMNPGGPNQVNIYGNNTYANSSAPLQYANPGVQQK